MWRAARVLACTALLAGFAPLGAALAREVRIGTEGAFPPYTFEDRAGVLRGFDIDLGEEICRRAALRCEWVVNDWETILPGLLAGKYDVVLAGMAATRERAKLVDFSLGYEQASEAESGLLVRVGAAIWDAPRVGVQGETIHEAWARSMRYRVTAYPTLNAAVEALFAGQVDEIVGPLAYIDGVARNAAGAVEIAARFGVPSGDTAAAFRKEDAALRRTFDSAIAEMLADGSIDRMAEKWFRAGDGTE